MLLINTENENMNNDQEDPKKTDDICDSLSQNEVNNIKDESTSEVDQENKQVHEQVEVDRELEILRERAIKSAKERKELREQEKVEEPVQEPVEEPVQEPVQEPVEEQVQEPVEEQVEEQVKEQVEEASNNNDTAKGNYLVKIFWDYQNVPIFSKGSMRNSIDSMRRIEDHISHLGEIVEKRVYFDATNEGDSKYSNYLQSFGWDQIHCPTRHFCNEGEKVEECETCKRPLKEVVKKEPNKKNTIDNTSQKRTVRKKIKKITEVAVDKELLPTDKEIIQESSNFSESAKKLILKMLDEEVISMSDVEMLLMKYPNKTIKKKQVNELVNTSKTKSKKRKRR